MMRLNSTLYSGEILEFARPRLHYSGDFWVRANVAGPVRDFGYSRLVALVTSRQRVLPDLCSGAEKSDDDAYDTERVSDVSKRVEHAFCRITDRISGSAARKSADR